MDIKEFKAGFRTLDFSISDTTDCSLYSYGTHRVQPFTTDTFSFDLLGKLAVEGLLQKVQLNPSADYYAIGSFPFDEGITAFMIGEYEDEQVACWVVEYEGIKTQPGKEKLLHVTTKVENGGKPVMSGERATEEGFKPVEPFYLEGIWK